MEMFAHFLSLKTVDVFLSKRKLWNAGAKLRNNEEYRTNNEE
jgi:hypothetical protein